MIFQNITLRPQPSNPYCFLLCYWHRLPPRRRSNSGLLPLTLPRMNAQFFPAPTHPTFQNDTAAVPFTLSTLVLPLVAFAHSIIGGRPNGFPYHYSCPFSRVMKGHRRRQPCLLCWSQNRRPKTISVGQIVGGQRFPLFVKNGVPLKRFPVPFFPSSLTGSERPHDAAIVSDSCCQTMKMGGRMFLFVELWDAKWLRNSSSILFCWTARSL